MIKITDKHIDALVEGIVDSWDLGTLVNYAKDRLNAHYRNAPVKEIVSDWEHTFGEDFPNK